MATNTLHLDNDFDIDAGERAKFANKLRTERCACRVMHHKLGVRKSLTKDQIKSAAATFDADGDQISATKKLIDTSDPTYRAVVSVRNRATDYWRSATTPYPEPSIRLIRKSRIEEFVLRMEDYRAELVEAVTVLQKRYKELRDIAEQQLGSLFNAADYPARVDTEFGLTWDFPSIEPAAHLKDLHPKLYEQECERIRVRFEEALQLAEAAFQQQLYELVTHLTERLKGGEDGKPKVFRDSAIENLNEFFQQFRNLDVGSSDELAELVDKAQKAVKGVSAEDLRANDQTRLSVSVKLSEVQQAMDALMVNKPKRAVSLEDVD